MDVVVEVVVGEGVCVDEVVKEVSEVLVLVKITVVDDGGME